MPQGTSFFDNLLRGWAGHDTGAVTPPEESQACARGPDRKNHFGCAITSLPGSSRVDGLAGCAGDCNHPCAAMSTGRAPAARCPSREGTTEMEEFSLYQPPVTEPAYVLALEARFWEFDSPLGHQFIVPLTQWPECLPVGGQGFDAPAERHFSRVSSMDQSTCLRSKGLHVRVVHVGPVSGACSAGTPGCGSKATMQRIANPQTPV